MTASLTSLSLPGLSSATIFPVTSLPSLVAFSKHLSAAFFNRFFSWCNVCLVSIFSILQGLARTPRVCTSVITVECNPSLIDPAEKVSAHMLNLYLRAERAIGAIKQHIGL